MCDFAKLSPEHTLVQLICEKVSLARVCAPRSTTRILNFATPLRFDCHEPIEQIKPARFEIVVLLSSLVKNIPGAQPYPITFSRLIPVSFDLAQYVALFQGFPGRFVFFDLRCRH